MQARAAISVELPVVFVTGVVLRASSSSGVEVNLPTVKCRFHIRYDNYGRTPAIITSECLDWQICPTLPPDPLYQRIYPASTGAIVRPNDHRVIDRETFDVDFSEQQILDVGNDRSRLWVYGFVSFRDFLGQRHQTGFCASVLIEKFVGSWLPDLEGMVDGKGGGCDCLDGCGAGGT